MHEGNENSNNRKIPESIMTEVLLLNQQVHFSGSQDERTSHIAFKEYPPPLPPPPPKKRE